jgi:hypothetical protein
MLTVNCLGLSAQLRRSLACITPNQNMLGIVRSRLSQREPRAKTQQWSCAGPPPAWLEAAKAEAAAAHYSEYTTKQKLEDKTKTRHSIINRQTSARRVQQRTEHPLLAFFASRNEKDD